MTHVHSFSHTQLSYCYFFFFFNDTATTEIYTLSLHDALPISATLNRHIDSRSPRSQIPWLSRSRRGPSERSEEHTSELQSRLHLVCRLLLEKKKKKNNTKNTYNKPSRHCSNHTHHDSCDTDPL